MDTITRLRIGDKLRKMKGKEEGVASFRKTRVAYAKQVQKILIKEGKEKRARSSIFLIFLPIVTYERTYSADRLYVLAEQVIWENS